MVPLFERNVPSMVRVNKALHLISTTCAIPSTHPQPRYTPRLEKHEPQVDGILVKAKCYGASRVPASIRFRAGAGEALLTYKNGTERRLNWLKEARRQGRTKLHRRSTYVAIESCSLSSFLR